MAQFPNAVVSFATKNPGDVIPSADWNSQNAEIVAIEDGYLNGTARLNSSASTLATLSVVGTSTFAGQVTFRSVPYTMPSSGGSTGQVLTCVSTSGSTMALEWRTPMWTLLKANNGTDSNAAAANVDTIAISGLSANDVIRVTTVLESVTQQTAQIILQQSTDGVTFVNVSPSPLGAGAIAMGEALIHQRQGNASNVLGAFQGLTGSATRVDNFQNNNVTQAWTGSWTLALRHGGVTAGGTFKWAWNVYKAAGQ